MPIGFGGVGRGCYRAGAMSLEARVILVALVGVVALFFGLGSILPQQWVVETSAHVPAEPPRVVALLADFGSWQKWSTLANSGRSSESVAVEGAPGTVGHQLAWRATDKEAVLRLARVDKGGIEYDFLSRLGAGEPLTALGHGSVRVEPDSGGAIVHWTDSAQITGFAQRWFAWFGAQQESVKQSQQASLAKLATVLEGK